MFIHFSNEPIFPKIQSKPLLVQFEAAVLLLVAWEKSPSPPGSSSFQVFGESNEASLESSLLQTNPARQHSCRISPQQGSFSSLGSRHFEVFQRSTAPVQPESGSRVPCCRQENSQGSFPAWCCIDPHEGEHGWLCKSSCILNTG